MTTPITADRDEGAAVTVIQADREAAAWAVATEAQMRLRDAVRRGDHDRSEAVKAFARHRLATEAACKAREDALVEVLRFMVDGRAGAREHAKATLALLALLARAHTATDAGGE